ncbi:hypothetical protein [Pedobacter duraquae]|uniref:Glycosyl transferase family 2 n=1 Tax=Pedobacter duraquae TaxID=425511 RepID=A0A4R6IA12_9SPHI|nr:hypothetical protein [Pedobacter duraquae]TDO19020.1 hypothetical protein CLV32_4642 [Pedobacter duraquae]
MDDQTKNFAILVNTTDSFEDCWLPFFTLFKKYWPNYQGKIYLNTETKVFTFPGLDIVSIQNDKINKGYRPSWSECLKRALDFIPNEVVLYLQEDYFLKEEVNNDVVEEFGEMIRKTPIDVIHLIDACSNGPFLKSEEYPNLLEFSQKASDRISCQAALWKKDVLKYYLLDDESGWQFETYGTKRAHFVKHKIFKINKDFFGFQRNQAVPYVLTGVILGRWKRDVVSLFDEHNLVVDFSKRGFHEPRVPLSFPTRLKNKIKRAPKGIKNRIKILNIILNK